MTKLEAIGSWLIIWTFIIACYQQITVEFKGSCDGGNSTACAIYRTMKLPS